MMEEFFILTLIFLHSILIGVLFVEDEFLSIKSEECSNKFQTLFFFTCFPVLIVFFFFFFSL